MIRNGVEKSKRKQRDKQRQQSLRAQAKIDSIVQIFLLDGVVTIKQLVTAIHNHCAHGHWIDCTEAELAAFYGVIDALHDTAVVKNN